VFAGLVAGLAPAGTASAIAAEAGMTTIPIVFSDSRRFAPMGLVPSLNRPDGNVTGVTNLGFELIQKQLELVHESLPTATIMAALVNPTFPGSETRRRTCRRDDSRLGRSAEFAYRDETLEYPAIIRADPRELHYLGPFLSFVGRPHYPRAVRTDL
jgi:hypothetical protein